MKARKQVGRYALVRTYSGYNTKKKANRAAYAEGKDGRLKKKG